MKLRLTKAFGFEMAHALTGYDGKCCNIHGHSYKLFVTIEGEPRHLRIVGGKDFNEKVG